MSEHPNTSTSATPTPTTATTPSPYTPQQHMYQPLNLPLLPTTTTTTTTTTPSSSLIREYRKGNWTLQETLTLITAKKLDDERRTKSTSTSTHCGSRTGELRWKWVENYCWNHGCYRSQNQCNDKWDNILRDYKKVRDYESQTSQLQDLPSYWNLDKQQRKDHNLPSNLSHEIFQALNQVVHTRYPPKTTLTTTSAITSTTAAIVTTVATTELAASSAAGQCPTPVTVQPPLPPPSPVAARAVSETSDSTDTDHSQKSGSDTKRRRTRNIGSSIIRSASILARTLESCQEKKDRRHREVMELEERRLQIEETQNEMNRQGMGDLVAAISNLSGAIQSLVSDHRDHT